ncbi:MAG: DUF11 domain-containing protein [Desulfobacteraceae bacterium]|nr:DUF11 domain-containing protein [Desulfobacteraceae bacterium]
MAYYTAVLPADELFGYMRADFVEGSNAIADLDITKTVDNAAPVGGEVIQFTITVTNNGPDATTGVQVTDVLDAGFTGVSYKTYLDGSEVDDGSGGTYAAGVWTIGNMGNGEVAELIITATVPATPGITITNYAEITQSGANDPDSDPGINRNTDDGKDGTPDNIDDDESSAAITIAPVADDVEIRLTAVITDGGTGDVQSETEPLEMGDKVT